MKYKLVLLLLLPLNLFAQTFDNIKHYKVNYGLANKTNEKLIVLRSFNANNQKYLLLLNPITLITKIDLSANYKVNSLKWNNILAIFRNTTYIQTIDVVSQKDLQLQNAGIATNFLNQKGITLTIDLCPSHKALDRIIFQSVFNELKNIQQPTPLSISVSGKWMLKHLDDLNWLKTMADKKELNITWINHTYNHSVNNLPLSENFLLAAKTNLEVEVLENEQLMLKNGIVPTIFFRFPGLVSSKTLVDKIVQNYGLIPIGSDAWLAKGQQANNGSIVLIHGNGNEETGVKDFLQLLKNKKTDIQNKQWLLFDLKQGLEKEFQ